MADMSKTSAFHLNGISYRQLRSRRNKLNNGEPIGDAVKKIFAQLFILILLIALVFTGLYGKYLIAGKLTDDGYFSLTMDSRYRKPVSFGAGITPAAGPYAALEALADWAGVPAPQLLRENERAEGAEAMLRLTEQTLPGAQAEMKQNMGNYELLEEVYRSLSEGDAAMVLMAIPEIITDKDSCALCYALVTGADFTAGNLTVLTPYGRYDTLSTDDFIRSTRLKGYDADRYETLGLLLGLYSPNTLYTVSKN